VTLWKRRYLVNLWWYRYGTKRNWSLAMDKAPVTCYLASEIELTPATGLF